MNQRRIGIRKAAPPVPSQTPAPPGRRKTPPESVLKLHSLVIDDKLTSTVEIADRMNEKDEQGRMKFPTASGVPWAANNIHSHLRTHGLLERIEKIAPKKPEPQAGVDPLILRQAAFDGARDAMAKAPPTPQVSAAVLSEAVRTALRAGLESTQEELSEAAEAARKLERTLQGLPLDDIKRVTERTGENVYEVVRKVGAGLESLEGLLEAGLERISDSISSALTGQLVLNIEHEVMERVVEERLKAHNDEMANRLALMVQGLKGELLAELTPRTDTQVIEVGDTGKASLEKIIDHKIECVEARLGRRLEEGLEALSKKMAEVFG